MATASGARSPSPSSLRRSGNHLPIPLPKFSDNAADRPIRPLPRRGIRSRLSDEQAEKIVYPPAPLSSSPLFSSPTSTTGDRNHHPIEFGGNGHFKTSLTMPPSSTGPSGNIAHSDLDGSYEYGQTHADFDSEDDYDKRNGHSRSFWQGGIGGGPSERPPNSAASSGDGYESFENSNNKKKRKIPIAGAHSASSPEDPDVTNSGVTPQFDAAYNGSREGVGHYYGSGTAATAANSGVGVSGAGRGRNGRSGRRSTGERQPLAASANALNASVPGNSNLDDSTRKGIISSAMAAAGNLPSGSAPKGQENVSLLQRQQQAGKSSSTSANDFTFECKSNSSNRMGSYADRYQNMMSPEDDASYSVRGSAPNAQSRHPQTQAGAPMPPHPPSNQPAGSQAPPPPDEKKQKPRKPGREYAHAARQRRLQQEYNNSHHPPRKEDVWICEFCEYESIFGEPPRALLREYEVKDYKKRKEAEERRRLLDKARAKGRKNKKGANKGQGGKNNAAAAGSAQNDPQYDPQYDDVVGQDPASPDGEYYDESLYEDGVDPPAPPGAYRQDMYGETYEPPPPPPRESAPTGPEHFLYPTTINTSPNP